MKKPLQQFLSLAWLAFLILCFQLSAARAQNVVVTYQGRVTDNGTNFTGIGRFKFALITTNGSVVTYWSNDGTSVGGSQPASAVTAGVNNGLFTIGLGDTSMANMISLSATLFANTNLQLQIWFSDGVNGFAALNPAQPLTTTPYAAYANYANGMTGLTVQTNTNGAPNLIGGSPVNYVAGGVIGATIAGGGAVNNGGTAQSNSVTASFGTVSGGAGNSANNTYATVGGGSYNTAGNWATVAGGIFNFAGGNYSTVPGGFDNTAIGNYSFAAGSGADALYQGDFVWADSQFGLFVSTSTDQFLVRAQGGVGIGTASPSAQLTVSSSGGDSFPQAQIDQGNGSDYARLRMTVSGSYPNRWDIAANASTFAIYSGQIGVNVIQLNSSGLTVHGTFVSSSDRNLKENFHAVNPANVLDRVAALPISNWNYKDDAGTRHIGPMAQDFYAAFNVGPDDKHITTIDEGGVALAAIQGLNEKLEAKAKNLEAENAELKARLDRLERLITATDRDFP